MSQWTGKFRSLPRNRRVAIACAAMAFAVAFATFCGWALSIPWLRGFGAHALPTWPVTGIGFLFLSLAFLLDLARMERATGQAWLLWFVPVGIALLVLFQHVTGIDFGTDQLLFHDAVSAYPPPYPGRPGASVAVALLFLGGAGLVLHRQKQRGRATNVGATVLFALATSASMLMLVVTVDARGSVLLAVAAPSALATLLLSLAFLGWSLDFTWTEVLTGREWRLLPLLLPLIILSPVLPSILEIALIRADMLSPEAREMLVALCNILAMGGIVYWGVTQLARRQVQLLDFRTAVDGTAVILTDADGRITHWSRGCAALYGWTEEEAIGQYRYFLLRSRCEQAWGEAMPRHPGPGTVELVETRRDGSDIATLERSYLLERPGRAPIHVFNITDISMAASAMTALRASQERLAIATTAHELGVLEWDVPTGKIHWSPGAEQRLGLVPGSIPDFESWREQVEPEDLKQIMEVITRTVADHADRFNYRYRFRQPNGRVRAVEGAARAFYDADGQFIRAVGVVLDITDHEAREAALRAQKAQLQSVLDTVPDPLIVLDENGQIIEFSPAARQLFGYSLEQVEGQDFTILVPESERPAYRKALRDFLRSGKGTSLVRPLMGLGETADGQRIPIEWRTSLARTDGKWMVTVSLRDISERLAAEERQSELAAELAHVSRQSAMSELAADLSHELNQPLAATSNFLAAARMLIDKGEDMERVSDLLRLGIEQTQRAGEIIRRLREFMAKGEVEIRAESLEQTVRDAADLVLVGTGQFDIRLTYDFDPAAPRIFADRIQIQQVLVNLLRNAIDALRNIAPERREIEIGSKRINDEFVEIHVADTGTGIPEKIINDLYNRFSTTKRRSGMGIGLSITKRIIEAHGGEITAENRPEGGAVFRFTLPIVEKVDDQ